ncbi:MAG TPA: glycine--tRNA ligase [Candidatus Babeliales bacterium]|nr:glycine--tRNA ligase [Candidatus Babeliales bacterium]
MSTRHSAVTLEKIVSLCKRRGFVYPTAEIYGGLNGVYDFGNLGTLLKYNLRSAWLTSINAASDDILLMEGALLAPRSVWEASGHISNFNDPMVDCLNCKHRYRADELDLSKPCPHCGQKKWTDVRMFNMMFKTNVGASSDQTSEAYLRPETAQAIFVNFKNIISTNRVKIPFGVAQIGKAFRNEINPKQFLFRMREFEQMEIEWFCKEETAKKDFEFWSQQRLAFYNHIGIDPSQIRLRAHQTDELSHYSTATSDIEYNFPFGWKELEGVAYRTNFDLTQHGSHSTKDLAVFDEATKTSYIPHVVECSVGVDRLFLTTLFDAYDEDVADGEQRIVLRLNPRIAPIKAALMPLTKKQVEPVEKMYRELRRSGIMVQLDESGSIGKRYRRQDEIGTPVCFTYDFESENDHCVTARNRDTMQQERISLDRVHEYLKNLIK